MNMKMVEDALKWMEQSKAVLTAEEKNKIAWYAFKTEDVELTQKLVEELTEKGSEREHVFEKFFAVADREDGWIEQMEMLLISIEILRLKEKQALELLMEILQAYGKEIAEKEKADEEKAAKEETEKRERLQGRTM